MVWLNPKKMIMLKNRIRVRYLNLQKQYLLIFNITISACLFISLVYVLHCKELGCGRNWNHWSRFLILGLTLNLPVSGLGLWICRRNKERWERSFWQKDMCRRSQVCVEDYRSLAKQCSTVEKSEHLQRETGCTVAQAL